MSSRNLLRVVALAALLSGFTPIHAFDSDGDGIDDALDVCCETPVGVAVDSNGRPVADLDGDCDVDLHDHALLQDAFFGPATSGCCFDSDCDDNDPCTVDACELETGLCSFTAVPHCGGCVLDETCLDELACDVPVLGEIASPTETDVLCFCVTEDEIVRISVIEQPGSGSNFGPNWRLLDAANNPAASCGAFVTTASADCGPLPAAGSPYRLLIEDAARNDVGTYKANLQRLRFSHACDDTEVTCDVPLALAINDTADEDLAYFSAKDGEVVRISVVEAVGSLPGFGVSWRVIDSLGHPERTCGTFAASVDRNCGPLFAGGNPYRIEIEDGGRNEVGDYFVNLQRLSATSACEGETVECGVPITTSIDSIGDSDLFNFRVSEGEIVRISIAELASQPANFGPSWRIIDGNGFAADSCGSFSSSVTGVDCGPLPGSRNPYRIEIQDGSRNDVGSCLVGLDRLTAHHACDQVELACDVTTPGTTASPVDISLFAFTVPEAEIVRVSIFENPGSGPSFAPSWRLLDGAGRPAPACGNFVTSTSLDCGPLPAARNPYRVEVEDQGHNDIGSFTVNVTYLTSGCP